MGYVMGYYRVYFNRHADPAQAWSVDCGEQDTEITCRGVIIEVDSRIEGGHSLIMTTYAPKEGDNISSPTAWISVRSDRPLIVKNGWVIIRDNGAAYE